MVKPREALIRSCLLSPFQGWILRVPQPRLAPGTIAFRTLQGSAIGFFNETGRFRGRFRGSDLVSTSSAERWAGMQERTSHRFLPSRPVIRRGNYSYTIPVEGNGRPSCALAFAAAVILMTETGRSAFSRLFDFECLNRRNRIRISGTGRNDA